MVSRKLTDKMKSICIFYLFQQLLSMLLRTRRDYATTWWLRYATTWWLRSRTNSFKAHVVSSKSPAFLGLCFLLEKWMIWTQWLQDPFQFCSSVSLLYSLPKKIQTISLYVLWTSKTDIFIASQILWGSPCLPMPLLRIAIFLLSTYLSPSSSLKTSASSHSLVPLYSLDILLNVIMCQSFVSFNHCNNVLR